jgi:hypothetical protein
MPVFYYSMQRNFVTICYFDVTEIFLGAKMREGKELGTLLLFILSGLNFEGTLGPDKKIA